MNKKYFRKTVVLTAAIAALALVSILAFQMVRHLLTKENEALVHSVAKRIQPALLVNDAQQVDAVMKALEIYPGVQTAELVNAQGASMANYVRVGQPLDVLSPAFELASASDDLNQLHVMAPITFDSLIVANLHIAVNLWPTYLRLMTWLGILLIVPSFIYLLVKQLRIKVRFEKVSGHGGGGNGDVDGDGDPCFDLHAATSQAMADAEISLEYQPIRRLNDGGLFGMEVVVCWQHPSGQTLHVSPANFASLAKKAGISLPFDAWLLRTVCEKSAAWQQQYGPLVLGLDISEAQFMDPSFTQAVRDTCEAAQYPHQLLELEVRESIFLRQPQLAIQAMQAFASRGLSVTVEGFGLMQSSLSMMKSLPIQKVKLDAKLSKNLLNDAHVARLTRATISQAMACNVRVTTEGLESHQQLVALQQMGCLCGQGAYFRPPLSEKDFVLLLVERYSDRRLVRTPSDQSERRSDVMTQ